MTPAIKHLIHKRCSAFRNRDFVTYHHLKWLICTQIAKAKKDWAQKYASPSDLWEKVNVLNISQSRNCKDSLDQSIRFTQ